VSDLSAERIEPLLRGRLGRPYLHVGECDSTQQLLPPDSPEGAVATADHQTAGRGRRGRTWVDEPGAALLVSIVLRPAKASLAAELSLVCALAVAEAVEEAIGRPAGVKWPNDVVVEGRKVGGILLEGRDGAVVCGIGVNVNQTAASLPDDARAPAASLRTLTGRDHDRAASLVEVLEHLEAHYDAWCATGLEPLLQELARRDALRGRQVRVGNVTGTALGIAADGRLRIRSDDGAEKLVASGEAEVPG